MINFQIVVVPPGGGEAEFTFDIKSERVPQSSEYIRLSEEDGESLFYVRNVTTFYKDNPDVPVKDFIEKAIVVEVEPINFEFQSETQLRMIERFRRQGLQVKEWEPSGY